MELRGSDVTLG